MHHAVLSSLFRWSCVFCEKHFQFLFFVRKRCMQFCQAALHTTDAVLVSFCCFVSFAALHCVAAMSFWGFVSHLTRPIYSHYVPTVCNIVLSPHILLFLCKGTVHFGAQRSLRVLLPLCTVWVTVTNRLGDVTRASLKADDPGISSLLQMRLCN